MVSTDYPDQGENCVDFLREDIGKLFKVYLRASILSAMMTSIYSFVDSIAVGQSTGPTGTAVIAIVNPLYGLTAFLGLFCGIGGSVLMTSAKTRGDEKRGNQYFTSTLILSAIFIAILWAVFLLFPKQLFTFFGADESTLPYVKQYAALVIAFLPMFVLPLSIAAFVRNDGAPGVAMASVIVGGCLNMFGDWFFVFPLGMGLRGAALATVLGYSTQTVIVCSYLFRKDCRLKLCRPDHMWKDFRQICSAGIGSGLPDLGNVVTLIIMNNQLMRYSGSDALAVYGAVGTIMALFQSMFSGVGQAIQPLVSANYAAQQKDRINQVMRLAFRTAGAMGVVFFALGELFPRQITNLFIDATPEVLEIAPTIIRWFFPVFLTMWINVVAIYYLQSVRKDRAAMMVGLGRSLLVSAAFLLVLPLFWGLIGVLVAMPLSELVVAVCALLYMKRIQPALYRNQDPDAWAL